jgi:phosphorylase kinase alpha/beta subunit
MDDLERFHDEVRRVILSRQHPITGLLPAGTAVNAHGDYTDAWVRDNVYAVQAVWALALAYRKADDPHGRGLLLEHAVVRLMRGLLQAMMRQRDKVEAFKTSQDPRDALHAKYDTATGGPVVADDAWGHLQLDATALYLLSLAQVTASGLAVVQSESEVRFVQNLVYYVGRAYRTPDYGIWERGDKTNHGLPELNASSVGMAKAALEALSGLNLLGPRGGHVGVVHVDPDEIARARITLDAMLPRESASKEVDAALLAVVSYPAFAVDDDALARRTHAAVAALRGRYGLKRFLRDGHQTVIEDPHRLHYDPEELQRFAGIESEWPLFEAYLALDALFRGDVAGADVHLARLDELALDAAEGRVLPELYRVRADDLERERAEPGATEREPNDNVPLVWAQSLWLVARLLRARLLQPADLDPLGRARAAAQARRPVVQLAILAEDADVAADLADLGVAAEPIPSVAPVRIRRAADLALVYAQVGRAAELGLTGRPPRRLQSLATSRVYLLAGERYLFLPALFDRQEFYLALDPLTLLERVAAEIAYVHRHWALLGRPTLAVLLGRDHLVHGRDALLTFMAAVRRGDVNGVPVTVGPLRQLVLATAVERLDDLGSWRDEPRDAAGDVASVRHAAPLTVGRALTADEALAIELEGDGAVLVERLVASTELHERVELLGALAARWGLDAPVEPLGATLRDLLEGVYASAGASRVWPVVRQAAGWLGKTDPSLSDALADLLVAQRSVVIGRAYAEAATVTRPLPHAELREKIDRFARDDVRDRALTQEVIVALSSLVRAAPELFRGVLTLRVGHLIGLLALGQAEELDLTPDQGYEALMQRSPAEIVTLLRGVLSAFDQAEETQRRRETVRLVAGAAGAGWAPSSPAVGAEIAPPEGWWRWRSREGALSRVPPGFYARVWRLLGRADGLVIGDKLDRRNRLASAPLRAATTAGEKNFALRVEQLLHRIPSHEYRRLVIEGLDTLAALAEAMPDWRVEGDIVLDVVLGHAVRRAYLAQRPEVASTYERVTAAAWAAFYDLGPRAVAAHVSAAVRFLAERAAAADAPHESTAAD